MDIGIACNMIDRYQPYLKIKRKRKLPVEHFYTRKGNEYPGILNFLGRQIAIR